jgi:hypothetical protein
MKINVPKTVKEAQAALSDLDDLITAKEWSRAAIVWAFTEQRQGRRSDLAGVPAKLSVTEFAKLGIHGLRDRGTVVAYREAWEWAVINHGAPDHVPGDRIELPDIEWPGRQDGSGQRRYVEADPSALARAMGRGKIDAESFAQDIDADTAAAIVGRIAEDRPGIVAEAVAQSGDAARAVARNARAREAVEDEGIQVRANQPMTKAEQEAMEKKVRRGSHGVAEALDIDEAVEYLRGAAREIAHAVMAAEEFGITDEDGEAQALASIRRWLRVYEGKAEWTDADADAAEAMGITL